jgi:hypothetical protein
VRDTNPKLLPTVILFCFRAASQTTKNVFTQSRCPGLLTPRYVHFSSLPYLSLHSSTKKCFSFLLQHVYYCCPLFLVCRNCSLVILYHLRVSIVFDYKINARLFVQGKLLCKLDKQSSSDLMQVDTNTLEPKGPCSLDGKSLSPYSSPFHHGRFFFLLVGMQ